VEVVKILRPSVVHVATSLDVGMGRFNQPVPEGVGTGVILDKDGHILTNFHVVRGAQRIIVTLDSKRSFEAELIGGDARTDTAVIRIDADGLVPAKLGVSAELQVGEDVIAIGHALGLRGGPTVSKGVVSALGRSIATGPQTTIVDLIQTDASINPGNSGGPLVNDRAEVVGMNTAIIRESRGIGFAINIDDAKAVAEQLVSKGYVERGFIGITPFDLTPAVISQTNLGLPIDVVEGIIVIGVGLGFPAYDAGMQAGDVIVEMAGQPIVNTGQLSNFLISHLPGETVQITYYRGKVRKTVTVTLVEQPPEAR
jgi:S1-C subfamily serine protease